MGNLVKSNRNRDSSLQLLNLNEEFLVSIIHHIVLITSLPFVHTARRSYRLNDPVKISDKSRTSIIIRKTNFEINSNEMLSKPYYLEEGEVVTR